MLTRRQAFPKRGPDAWDKCEAWEWLHRQQIPGCPKREITLKDGSKLWVHGWTKLHTQDAWQWVYCHPEECEHGELLRDCPHCWRSMLGD